MEGKSILDVGCGTGELAAGLAERFGTAVLPVWGSTETTGVALANRPGEAHAPCRLGRPVPGYVVRVLDEEGNLINGPGSRIQ